MKQTARKQLHARRGASIAIALLIFLLCALSGASAFMMASANAGRYSHSSEQEYYSVSSAAIVLVDLLNELTYTSEQITLEYTREWSYEDGEGHTSSDHYTLTIPEPDPTQKMNRLTHASSLRESNLALCTLILDYCDSLVPYLYVPEEWYGRVDTPKKPEPSTIKAVDYEFDMSVKSDKYKDTFGTVHCRLTMNQNCDLLMSFFGESGEYSITLYWIAKVSPQPSSFDPVYTYTDKDASGSYTTGSMTQKSVLEVKVEWDKENVTISRGEANAKE